MGISCGQVVAGVVGTKRFLFDMWGDAVNVAARMEQQGLPGQIQGEPGEHFCTLILYITFPLKRLFMINIMAVTKEVVDNAGSDFSFACRGQMDVKGKGMMDTYLLKSARTRSLRRSAYVKNYWKPSPISAVRAVSMNDPTSESPGQSRDHSDPMGRSSDHE